MTRQLIAPHPPAQHPPVQQPPRTRAGHAALAEQIRQARIADPSLEFWFDSHPRLQSPDTPATEAVADTLGHYGPSSAGSPELAAQLTGVTTNPNLIEEYDAVVRCAPMPLTRAQPHRDQCTRAHIASAAQAMRAAPQVSRPVRLASAQVSPVTPSTPAPSSRKACGWPLSPRT